MPKNNLTDENRVLVVSFKFKENKRSPVLHAGPRDVMGRTVGAAPHPELQQPHRSTWVTAELLRDGFLLK